MITCTICSADPSIHRKKKFKNPEDRNDQLGFPDLSTIQNVYQVLLQTHTLSYLLMVHQTHTVDIEVYSGKGNCEILFMKSGIEER